MITKETMLASTPILSKVESKLNFEVLFKTTPNPYLILLADSKFTIVEVNEAYLQATGISREKMVGRGMFDVFPDNPSDPDATGVSNLRASFERVVISRKLDIMPIQKYDILSAGAEDNFEVRYWIPRNMPICGEKGAVDFIIHNVEDVTEFVKLKQQKIAAMTETETLQARTAQMEAEIYQHYHEIKKVQEELRSSNERYQILTSILPVGIFHTDLEGNCFFVNPQWQEITGLDFDTLKDKRWFQLVPSSEQITIYESWRHSIAKKEIYKIEFRIQLKNKEERWVLAQLAPNIDRVTGQIKTYVGSLTDITEGKKVQEERKKRIEELAEIDRAKTVFLSNVSHEFRTPITLILGTIEDILTKRDEVVVAPKIHEDLLLIRRNTLRLLKLVNSLLDFSCLEAGRMNASYESTDLCQFTADLVGVFRSVIEKSGLKLNVDVSSLRELVYVDKDMWEKIVFNLLSNALKNTLEGSITVTLKKKDNFAELNITDTGIGISDKELPRIFERFYRVEQPSGRSHEGTGIGLSLTEELVKLHGGNISVTSELGKGSSFIVRIPFGSDHLPKDHVKDKTKPGTQLDDQLATAFVEESLGWLSETMTSSPSVQYKQMLKAKSFASLERIDKRKILVVDDNSDMRNYLTGLLSRHWVVFAADNGETALKLAFQEKPDLILSDIMMPRIDGFQLVRKVRESSEMQSTPIILLSAKAGEDCSVEGIQSGADDYLVKPFSNKELIARVRMHLELGHLRADLERRIKERTLQLHETNALLQDKINELKMSAATLAKSEESYRLLATISPTGIFHCNKEGTISYFNEKFYKLLGLTPEAAKEMKWLEIVHPDDKERVLSLWNDFSNGKNKCFKQEFRLLHNGQSCVWVILEIVSEEGGNGFVGTVTDITELKELDRKRYLAVQVAEEQQRKRAEEAEKHRKQQESFIDTMCHELRNPLNGIYGNITLLKMNLVTLEKMFQTIEQATLRDNILQNINQSKQSIEAIAICAQHQKIIADDVLELSRLEAGKVKLVHVEFNPSDIVKNVIKMLELEVNKKNIQVSMKLSSDLLVKGDPHRLLQVLFNLISNAIKFTPDGGKIIVTWTQATSKEMDVILTFSVEDTGIGLSSEEQTRMFERFEQAKASTAYEYGGSGLGLCISQDLIQLMGGTIDVKSEKDKGTKFSFTIKCKPCFDKKEVTKPLFFSPLEHREPPKVKLNILVVEDNSVNQKLMKKFLDTRNYIYDIANNGKEAVSMWEAKEYDIVLMDIEMPIMDGLEATKEIRKKESEIKRGLAPIPIIGVSGNARKEQIDTAISCGMDEYLTKPVNIDTLFEKIDFCIANRDKRLFRSFETMRDLTVNIQ